MFVNGIFVFEKKRIIRMNAHHHHHEHGDCEQILLLLLFFSGLIRPETPVQF